VSTSTDNTVTWDVIAPTVTINQTAGGAAFPAQTVGTGSNASGSSTLGLTVPSGSTTGDVLVAGIALHGGTSSTITAPSCACWTQIARADNGTANVTLVTYYHVVTGAEPGSYTWTGISPVSSPIGRAAGGILRYSGIDTASPIRASGGQTGSGTSVQAPSISATAGDMLIYFGAIQASGSIIS